MSMHHGDTFLLGFAGGDFFVVGHDEEGLGIGEGLDDAWDEEEERPEKSKDCDAQVAFEATKEITFFVAGHEVIDLRGTTLVGDTQENDGERQHDAARQKNGG